jgi:hypothetical protein
MLVLPPGTWANWDRQRLKNCGGAAEQYKHPCLIGDPDFRNELPVEQELSAGPNLAAG